jgi:NAD-dependent dihydropyrimidine dehydrogenase PreA subunit
MSYIIGDKCVSVCDTACLKVCPVDCINGPIDINGFGKEVNNMTKEELIGKQLYINPAVCVLCGACEPECPVGAIYPTEQLTIKMEGIEPVNRNYEFYNMKYENKV